MRQIGASLMLAVFLVAGWSTKSWGVSEAEVSATLARHKAEREKILAEIERRKKQAGPSQPNAGTVTANPGSVSNCRDDPFCDLRNTNPDKFVFEE